MAPPATAVAVRASEEVVEVMSMGPPEAVRVAEFAPRRERKFPPVRVAALPASRPTSPPAMLARVPWELAMSMCLRYRLVEAARSSRGAYRDMVAAHPHWPHIHAEATAHTHGAVAPG